MADTASHRIRSVDALRGLACVLMAIDHVRVYSGLPAGGPTAGIFFTRWVTHFVAPWFCLLAGVGAWFLGKRLADPSALAGFLAKRGLMLVVMEVTLIRLLWTFSLDYSTFVLAGVIWMLGWCMVLLAPLVYVRPTVVGWAGVAMIAFQQLFALPPRLVPEAFAAPFATLWEFVYSSGFEGPEYVAILYVIVPWVGVMMAGYGLGLLLDGPAEGRRRLCLRLGFAMTALFVVAAGALALFGAQGSELPWFVRLLGQQKYPPSQLFLLMTIGPGLVLMGAWEGRKSLVIDAMDVFGRVPFFYYWMHILTIHVAAVLVMRLRGAYDGAWFSTAPYTSVPEDQRWSLLLLYGVWAVVVFGVLYPACRWFAAVKRRSRGGWLRYV